MFLYCSQKFLHDITYTTVIMDYSNVNADIQILNSKFRYATVVNVDIQIQLQMQIFTFYRVV